MTVWFHFASGFVAAVACGFLLATLDQNEALHAKIGFIMTAALVLVSILLWRHA